MLTSRMLAVQKKHLELEKMQRSWKFKKDPQIYLKVRKMLKEQPQKKKIREREGERERERERERDGSKKMLQKEGK